MTGRGGAGKVHTTGISVVIKVTPIAIIVVILSTLAKVTGNANVIQGLGCGQLELSQKPHYLRNLGPCHHHLGNPQSSS